jgi:hypothetical protein
MSDDLRQSADQLLSGYQAYTAADDIVAAGAENNTHIIMTVTMTQTETTIFTPESPLTTVPCYLA